MKRLVTAREQAELAGFWRREAMPTYYHLTDNPDFTLDPQYVPEVLPDGIDIEPQPGIFVTPKKKLPVWRKEYDWDRPYTAEVFVPRDIDDLAGERYPYEDPEEIFIPAKHWNMGGEQVQVRGVRPTRGYHPPRTAEQPQLHAKKMKRLVTAREQAELAGFWHTAADEDAPKKIYRGIRVTNFPEELLDRFRELQQMPMEESEVGQHLQIGPMVLDHLTNTPWKPFTNTPDDLQYTGLGRHWTRRRDFAETAASNQIGPGISVILEADDPGDQYYDPDIPMTGKRPDGTGWEEEEEATLLPDTPLNVTSIRMPGWSAEEVLDDPYYHNMEQEYGHPYPGGPRPGVGGVARDPFAKKAATDDDWYRQAVRIASLQADQDYYLPASDDWEDPATKGPQTLYRGLVVPSPVDLEGLIRSVGRSWTSDEDRSALFSDPQEYEGIPGIDAHGYRGGEGPFVGVNLEADWNGDLDSVDYNWRRIQPDEDEVRLRPGTPISVRNMHYVYPDYGWDDNNVLADGPRTFHADWYRQAARIAAQAAELEWRHSLDGGPEWELIANPPTGQTQVIQTEDSRHQHYGAAQPSIGDMPGWLADAASEIEHIKDTPFLPGMESIPASPQIVTDGEEDIPRFDLRHPQPSIPGMEVVQPADGVVRDLKRTPSEGAAPYGDRLERALYDEFMDWWPTSTAYATRTNDEGGPDQWVTTGWMHHPDEPITHWMNVEDFLKERYPEAATGSHYGLEDADQVMGYLDRWDRPDPPTEEEMRGMGYTSLGNVYTQAMLNLHNKLQGRNWATDADRDRYMRLMLKHLGPQKAARLARLAASSFSCPPGQPGCVSAMGNPLKVEMPESKAPTAADYAEPWDANQTPADYSNSSYYIDRSGVGYPSSGGGTGGGGSWGGGGGGTGGGGTGSDGIMDVSRPLYNIYKQRYPDVEIGGYRPGGDGYDEHNRGALDIMHPEKHGIDVNWAMQEAFKAGAPWAIYNQTMHYPDPSRNYFMENRGDPTQNHYDHIHIGPIGGG